MCAHCGDLCMIAGVVVRCGVRLKVFSVRLSTR